MTRIAQIALFAGVALAAPQAQLEARWTGWGGWNGWKQSTTTTADVATSTPLATSTPVVVVPVTSATSTSVAPVATSTPPPATTAAPSATTGKRGVAYNTASYAAMFTSSPEVSWAYNWVRMMKNERKIK